MMNHRIAAFTLAAAITTITAFAAEAPAANTSSTSTAPAASIEARLGGIPSIDTEGGFTTITTTDGQAAGMQKIQLLKDKDGQYFLTENGEKIYLTITESGTLDGANNAKISITTK